MSVKMRTLSGLGCEARSSTELALEQAYPLYLSLREARGAEVVCVNASVLEGLLEEAEFAEPVRRSAESVWREFEQMAHVDESGPEARAIINSLSLPLPSRHAAAHDLANSEPVFVVELNCPVEEVFQRLLGTEAEAGLRHAAAAHDAVLAEWRRRFGGYVVCVRDDSLLLDVVHPPSTHAEIREVLWQHYIYCDGEQGVDLESAARGLCELPTQWSFWWD